MLIVDLYSEKKMDSMDTRLRNIEASLAKLADSKISPQEYGSSATGTDRRVCPPEWLVEPTENGQHLSGEHFFKTQTVEAGDFLERAVAQGQIRELNPSIHASIINLRGLIEREGRRPSVEYDTQSPLQKSIVRDDLGQLLMPPITLVIPLLNKVTGIVSTHGCRDRLLTTLCPDAEPSLFTYNLMHVGIHDFMPICQAFYASPGTSSIADLAVVNAGLYYLFVEQKCNEKATPYESREYDKAACICQRNLEMAIRSYPLFLSPEIINVQALIFSVGASVFSWTCPGLIMRTRLGTLCGRFLLAFGCMAP